MNQTTERFARTSRVNGYEYAASIEHTRRRDRSGVWIVVIVVLLIAVPYIILAVRT